VLDETVVALTPQAASPEVARAVKRLALVAVAGEKASALGILPWNKGEAVKGVKAVLSRYLAARDGVGSDIERAIVRLREFILTHGSSRFRELSNETDRIINLAGYRDLDNGFYYLTPAGLREACRGYDPVSVARLLKARGLLRAPDTGHLMERISVPGVARVRLYAVSAEILHDEQPVGEPLDRSTI
jgi:hypothetical protein